MKEIKSKVKKVLIETLRVKDYHIESSVVQTMVKGWVKDMTEGQISVDISDDLLITGKPIPLESNYTLEIAHNDRIDADEISVYEYQTTYYIQDVEE